MSRSLKVDDKNNLLFGENLFVCEGDEALRQDVKNKLSIWMREYPFDLREGIDYLDILGSGNRNLVVAKLREVLLKDKRIDRVDVAVKDQEMGKLTLEVEILTREGNKINV